MRRIIDLDVPASDERLTTMTTTNDDIDDATLLWTSAETARRIGWSEVWLREQRAKGKGPAFFRVGKTVRYRREDVVAWIEACRVEGK